MPKEFSHGMGSHLPIALHSKSQTFFTPRTNSEETAGPLKTTPGLSSQALSFLKTLFAFAPEGSLVELRLLGPDKKPSGEMISRQEWHPVKDLPAIQRAAMRHDARGAEVYLGVNPRLRKGGGAHDVACISALVADLDVAKPECVQKKCDGKDKTGKGRWCKGCRYPDGRKKHPSKEEARKDLDRLDFLLGPTLIVDSGGGLHAYWLLREPLDIKEAPEAGQIMRRLAAVLSGDVVCDPPRILRLPGTHNHKQAPPRPVRLLHSDAARLYNLFDLDDLLPPSTQGRWVQPLSRPTGPLPKDLSQRTLRVLEALKLPVQPILDRATGGFLGVKILAPCPACHVTHEQKSWLSPFGSLKCWRGSCEAGPNASGQTPEGTPIGLPLPTWVERYAKDALGALALPRQPVPSPPKKDICLTLSEAEARLASLLKEAIAWSKEKPGRAALLACPPGLGKTREALRLLVEMLGMGTLLALSHALLDEREQEASSLGLSRRRRYHGLLSPRTQENEPVCRFEAQLGPWAERGWPLRNTACGSCHFRENYDGEGQTCPAFSGRKGQGTRFATHAHAPALARTGELRPPLLVDELPALLHLESIDQEELSALTALNTSQPLGDWCAARAPLARIIIRAARSLMRERQQNPTRYALRVGGEELSRRLQEAALEEAKEGQLALLDTKEAGQTLLNTAVEELRRAHAHHPTPPLPGDLGEIMRKGLVHPTRYPHRHLDEILLALVGQGTGQACLVLEGQGPQIRVKLEWRRLAFDSWRDEEGLPLSLVVLDASSPLLEAAIRAALPSHEVRVFRLSVSEPPHIKRVHLLTSSLTRSSLLHSQNPGALCDRAGPALAHVLRELAQLLEHEGKELPTLGVITHAPLAQILKESQSKSSRSPKKEKKPSRALSRVQDELGSLQKEGRFGKVLTLHYGAQRGSNQLQHCDALALLGDPWADASAATEDARTLGVDPDLYLGALLDAEVLQAFGRARALRREPDRPLLLVYAGRQTPAVWAGLPVEVLPLPEHGRPPRKETGGAEALARAMAYRWGAGSPSLARLCAAHPGLCAFLEQRAEIAIKDDLLNSNFRPLTKDETQSGEAPTPSALFEEAAALPPRRLREVFQRALGDLPEVRVGDPLRPPEQGGHWRVRESRPGAAAALVSAVRAYFRAQSLGGESVQEETALSLGPSEFGGQREGESASLAGSPRVEEALVSEKGEGERLWTFSAALVSGGAPHIYGKESGGEWVWDDAPG